MRGPPEGLGRRGCLTLLNSYDPKRAVVSTATAPQGPTPCIRIVEIATERLYHQV